MDRHTGHLKYNWNNLENSVSTTQISIAFRDEMDQDLIVQNSIIMDCIVFYLVTLAQTT